MTMEGPHYYLVRYTDDSRGFVLRDSEGRLTQCCDLMLDARPDCDYTVLEDLGSDDGSESFGERLEERASQQA